MKNLHSDDHDLGLTHDLRLISRRMAQQALQRRRLLGLMLGAGAVSLLPGCDGDAAATVTDSSNGRTGIGTTTTTTTSSSGSCVADPTETNGPYPSDGSNSANGSISNVLLQSGVVRSDIRSSFGTSGNAAPGVPLQLDITIVDSNASCAPLGGYAVYLWHCTRDGLYSLYSSSVQNEDFLRGVQVSDANGKLSFSTIYPGCYDGRYPHVHFEVYQSLALATGYANRVLVSQMAMPRTVSSSVYSGATGYSASIANLAKVSIASDNVFGDNTDAQILAQTPSLTGSVDEGFNGTIVIGLAR
ncbi:MAG: intradiol ring-cleavage dioxygenase [Pseudomonadota bacterium]